MESNIGSAHKMPSNKGDTNSMRNHKDIQYITFTVRHEPTNNGLLLGSLV